MPKDYANIYNLSEDERELEKKDYDNKKAAYRDSLLEKALAKFTCARNEGSKQAIFGKD